VDRPYYYQSTSCFSDKNFFAILRASLLFFALRMVFIPHSGLLPGPHLLILVAALPRQVHPWFKNRSTLQDTNTIRNRPANECFLNIDSFAIPLAPAPQL